MGRDPARFLPELVEREHQCSTAEHQPTAAHRAVSLRGIPGITMVDDHPVEIGAQVIGDELRERGLLPLTMRRDPGEDRDRSTRLDSHGRTLPRTEGADFDVRGETDAQVPPLLALRLLLPAQLPVTGRVQRGVERSRVIPAVIFDAGRGLVGEPFRRDEVDAPDFGRVHP